MKKTIDSKLLSEMHKLCLFVGGLPDSVSSTPFNSETADGHFFEFRGSQEDLEARSLKAGYTVHCTSTSSIDDTGEEKIFWVIGLELPEYYVDIYSGMDTRSGEWLMGIEKEELDEFIFFAIETTRAESVIFAHNDDKYEFVAVFIADAEEYRALKN